MKKPTIDQEINEDALENVNFFSAPIPGQSLTNDPETPYPWETAPEFTTVDSAMMYFADILLDVETYAEMMSLIKQGQTIDALAQMILYTSFTEGKINPDLMLLCYEPLLFLLMAMAEKVNIEYDLDDEDVELDELNDDELVEAKNQITSITNLYNNKKEEIKEQSKSITLNADINRMLNDVELETVQGLLSKPEKGLLNRTENE
jgi:hypothetical protein